MTKFADRVVLILNLISAAGLLISYLAPVINPSKFFLPALFGLAYPYLLMVNLAFLCFWIIRLKKEVLLSLVVILLGWNHLNNLLPMASKNHNLPDKELAPRAFKVLSYNVRGFDRYHWTDDPNTRNEIVHFLDEQAPDIVCLQEYYTSVKRGETQAELSRHLSRFSESAIYYIADPANRNGFGIRVKCIFLLIYCRMFRFK